MATAEIRQSQVHVSNPPAQEGQPIAENVGFPGGTHEELEPAATTAILFHVICGGQIGEEFLVHADCSLGVMLNFIKLRLKTDFAIPENGTVELFDEHGHPLGLSKADPYDRGHLYVKHRAVYFPMFFLPPENEEEIGEAGATETNIPSIAVHGGGSDEALSMKTRPSTFAGSTDVNPEDHLSPNPSPSRNRKNKKGDRSQRSSKKKSRQKSKSTVSDYKEDEGEHDSLSQSKKPTDRSRGSSRPESGLSVEQPSRPETINKRTTTPIEEEHSAEKSDPNWIGDPPVTPNDESHLSENDNSNKHFDSLAEEAPLEHPHIVEFAGEADGLPVVLEDAADQKPKSAKSQTNVSEKSGVKSQRSNRSESSKKRKGERGVSVVSESGSNKSKSRGQVRSKKLIEVELSSSPSLALVAASKEEFDTDNKTPDHSLMPEESPAVVHPIKHYFPDKKPVEFVPVIAKTFKGCIKLCKWVLRLHEEIDKGVKDMDCMINDMVAQQLHDDEEEMVEEERRRATREGSSTNISTATAKTNGKGEKKKSKKGKNRKTVASASVA